MAGGLVVRAAAAGVFALVTPTPQSSDEQRFRGEGSRGINDFVEPLIIAHWGEPQRAYVFLFAADICVPELFQCKDRLISLAQSVHGATLYCMTIRPIVIHGDPVLHTPTEPVTVPVSEIRELIDDMFETLYASGGVGLAANQVGVNKRLFVFHCPDVDGPHGTDKPDADIQRDGGRIRTGCVINPVLETSEIPETMPATDGSEDEGCLSLPGEGFPTGRADWARVTGVDENGESVSIEGYGFFARLLQHEVGHLDGYVYTDVLIGRNKRAAKKAIKRNGWTTGGLTWLPGTDPDPFAPAE